MTNIFSLSKHESSKGAPFKENKENPREPLIGTDGWGVSGGCEHERECAILVDSWTSFYIVNCALPSVLI